MRNFVFRKLTAALCLSALWLAMASCTKTEEPNTNPGGGSELPVFDFSTKSTYTLNVNYDVPAGYQVCFEVYTENPFTLDDNGQLVKIADLEPIDKAYTDAKGAYSNTLVAPAYVKTFYIYTPNKGVTELMEARVENGVLMPATFLSRVSTSEIAGTRAAMNMEIIKTNFDPNGAKVKTLGKWIHCMSGYDDFPNVSTSILPNNRAKIWGRPTYLKYVDQSFYPGVGEPTTEVDAVVWNTINSVLTGEDKHQDFYKDVMGNGDIKVYEAGEIDVKLLADRGQNQNSLLYYCYDTNNPPVYRSDIKTMVVAFPNTKVIGVHYPGFDASIFDYGSMRPGEGIRLRYIDQAGVDHGTTFPAGVSIGWIVCSNGYQRAQGAVGMGFGMIYSNQVLNNNVAHTALFRHRDFVVLSFEDVVKQSVNDLRDYDDVMFAVSATPASAITPGVPDKDPEPPTADKVVSEVTYRGILLFEDIWPFRGDFDMNDVAVRYVSKVGYNINNRVVETKDDYTLMWSGAQLNNSFAYQNYNLRSGQAAVTIEGGDGTAALDAKDGSIMRLASKVLDYANLSKKTTTTVSVKYAMPIDKRDFILPPYNPFITVRGADSHEVHLTNMQPTIYADRALLGTGHDRSKPDAGLFYVTYNEDGVQMPFGIDVMFESDEKMNAFVIPQERQGINTHYSGFMGWILSGGKTNQDWFLHPSK